MNPSSKISIDKKAGGLRREYTHYTKRKGLVIASTALIMVVLVVVSLLTGSSTMMLGENIAALFGQGTPQANQIVWVVRMPHILTALVGGIALGMAGCAFQSVLQNPLASPSTLGISQGAAFGAAIAIIALGAGTLGAHDGVSFTNPYITALCAFVGAMLSALAILALSRFRELTPESVILAGVALSALFAGATALIQYFADDTQVAAVVFWTFGSLRRTSYSELGIMGIITVICGAYFIINRWNYNAMESGEHSAHSLGVSVKSVRLTSMIVGTLAAASIIAFCGTINFIGLVAPHIMRKFVGSDYRYLLPASALCGGAILLAADLIAANLVAGAILPIGAITSFVGAPVFIYLLAKGARR